MLIYGMLVRCPLAQSSSSQRHLIQSIKELTENSWRWCRREEGCHGNLYPEFYLSTPSKESYPWMILYIIERKIISSIYSFVCISSAERKGLIIVWRICGFREWLKWSMGHKKPAYYFFLFLIQRLKLFVGNKMRRRSKNSTNFQSKILRMFFLELNFFSFIYRIWRILPNWRTLSNNAWRDCKDAFLTNSFSSLIGRQDVPSATFFKFVKRVSLARPKLTIF